MDKSIKSTIFAFSLIVFCFKADWTTARSLDPGSFEYAVTFDLIEGKGKELKKEFDSLVNVMYEYNLTQNNRNRQLSDSYNETIESSSPVHKAYIARIMPVLEILYDYRYTPEWGTLRPYLTEERPGIDSDRTLPLLKMYLSDAPDIDADWLYDQWCKIIRRNVMQHRLVVYYIEARTIQKISEAKGYTDSTGNPLQIFEADPNEIKRKFPRSAWAKCLEQMYDLDPIVNIIGALKNRQTAISGKN